MVEVIEIGHPNSSFMSDLCVVLKISLENTTPKKIDRVIEGAQRNVAEAALAGRISAYNTYKAIF